MTAASSKPVRSGRRETNKQEKLARIRHAAKNVFLRNGYEAATVREIASAADVAFGTVFLYAKNKQDLLLLIFEEEIMVLSERAFRKAKARLPFVDQLIAFFSEIYEFFCRTPQLSRDMLKEITFSTGGIVAKRLWASVQDTEHNVARIVARAQANGEVSSSISPDLVAHVIFSLYRVEIRFCLDQAKPNVEGSLTKLKGEFEVLISGLAPRHLYGASDVATTPIKKLPLRRGKKV
jgi:AcrR family transcriptional regulator